MGPGYELPDGGSRKSGGGEVKRIDMNENKHKEKMIAPIIITVVFLIYLVAYFIAVIMTSAILPVMILFAIPLIALGFGMVYILKTRIDEIRSGEEDDLSNY